MSEIGQLTVTPIKRQNAIDEINAKAKQQKQVIQRNTEATNEEKAAAENSVDQAVATAIASINGANTNDQVDQAQSNGDNAITAINPVAKLSKMHVKRLKQRLKLNNNKLIQIIMRRQKKNKKH